MVASEKSLFHSHPNTERACAPNRQIELLVTLGIQGDKEFYLYVDNDLPGQERHKESTESHSSRV